jgi:UDP-2,3-diacylglucosamine hydrolase
LVRVQACHTEGISPNLTRLEQFTENGIPVHLIVGNHDFWLGKRFTEETGVHIYYEPVTINLNGKKFFLHHGDGLNERDRGYKILRSVLRNKINIFLYRLLHPDLGISLARKSSRTSRSNHSENGLSAEQSALRSYAMKQLSNGYDFVIMGHHHTPEQLNIGNRQYLNLGDWITHYSYAVFDGYDLYLRKWIFSKEMTE